MKRLSTTVKNAGALVTKKIPVPVQKALIETGIIYSALTTFSATTVWDASTGFGNNLWQKLQNLYCNAIFLPLLFLTLITLAFFAKDDKMVGMCKKAILWEGIVFIVLKAPTTVLATFEQFGSWFGGSAA